MEGRAMRRHSIAVALMVLPALSFPAAAWDRGRVKTFAVLPDGSSGPEGLEVDSAGNAYVTTFGFTASGSASGPGQLFVFDEDRRLLRQGSVAGSSTHLLGLRFHPITRARPVVRFGGGKVLGGGPHTGASGVVPTRPALPHPRL